MGDKWEISKWWFWLIGMLLVSAIVIGITRPISMRVEREVMVQSHQYKEGMAERVAVLQATLSEIDSQLMNPNFDEQTKAGLQNQRSAINAQLIAARR